MPGCAPAAGRAGRGPGSLCGPLPLTAAAGKAARAGSCPAAAASAGTQPGGVRCSPAAGRVKGCVLLLTLRVCRCSHRPQNGSCVPGEGLQELHM